MITILVCHFLVTKYLSNHFSNIYFPFNSYYNTKSVVMCLGITAMVCLTVTLVSFQTKVSLPERSSSEKGTSTI